MKLNEVEFAKVMDSVTKIYSSYRNQNVSVKTELGEMDILFQLVISEFGNRIDYHDLLHIITRGIDGNYDIKEGEINNFSPQNLKKWFAGWIYKDKAELVKKAQIEQQKQSQLFLDAPKINIETVRQIANECFVAFRDKKNDLAFSKGWIYDKLVEFNLISVPENVVQQLRQQIEQLYLRKKGITNFQGGEAEKISFLLGQHLANESIESKLKVACLEWYFIKIIEKNK